MLVATTIAYRYPSMLHDALHPTDLCFEPGTFTILTGPTGCGKSTLLRLLAGLLQRHGGGSVTGAVSWNGAALDKMLPSQRVRHLGFVAQNPDDQLIAGTLGDEIAFAAESAGIRVAEIEVAVASLLAKLGLPSEPARDVRALSGGQRQRLVIAAALSGGGEVLLLDEPLAHLDPTGASELVGLLRNLADAGRVVIAVEHRLESVYGACDRVVVMDAGRVVEDVAREQLRVETLENLGLVVPVDVALRGATPAGRPEVAATTDAVSVDSPESLSEILERGHVERGRESIPVLRSTPFSFGYQRHQKVLEVGDFSFVAGERVAIVGPNGAGKSTLLGVLTGEFGPAVATCAGRTVAVPQDPDLSLFCASVREELAYAPRDLGMEGALDSLAAAFSLRDLLDRPPQALSRGQRLRTAVAAALAARPAVLSLDEPTAGQDFDQVERLMLALRFTMSKGVLLFATHDLALALRHATRLIVLAEGRVLADGHPVEVLDRADVASLLPLPGALGRCRALGISLRELSERRMLLSPINLLRERTQ